MKKILMMVGGIVAVVGGIFAFIYFTSDKLVCTSTEGDITILYNDRNLTAYRASGLQYDFKTQRSFASKTGTKEYIADFKVWFAENTGGTCEDK